MATLSISISASKAGEPDPTEETAQLSATQDVVAQLVADGYSVTGSFSGASGSTDLAARPSA